MLIKFPSSSICGALGATASGGRMEHTAGLTSYRAIAGGWGSMAPELKEELVVGMGQNKLYLPRRKSRRYRGISLKVWLPI